MLRKILKPQVQDYTIRIPKEYLNRKIEILVFPVTDEEKQILISEEQEKDIIVKTAGILKNRNIDPVKWQKKVRDEWENRV